MTTHNTLEALTLGRADHVHPGTLLEEAATGMLSALCGQLGGVHAELLEELGGGDTQLLEVASNRLGKAALLLSVESHLDGAVTILLLGLDLAVSVAGHVDNRDGNHGAGLLVEDAGHANLLTNKS